MFRKGWFKDKYKHVLASRGIKTKSDKYKKPASTYTPKVIYHGTDEISAFMIISEGFKDKPGQRSKYAEAGYMVGTTEIDYAEIYAENRARQFSEWIGRPKGKETRGAILEVNVKGLPVENDPTVAIDSVYGIVWRAKLPVGPERVKIIKIVNVGDKKQ